MWKIISLDVLPQAGEDWELMTTLIEVVEPSWFAAAGDRLPGHLNSFHRTGMSWRCPGNHKKWQFSRKSGKRHNFPEKKGELKNLSSKPDLMSEIPGSGE